MGHQRRSRLAYLRRLREVDFPRLRRLYAAQAQSGQDDRQNIAERLRALLAKEFVELLVKGLGLGRVFFAGDLLDGILQVTHDVGWRRFVFLMEGS